MAHVDLRKIKRINIDFLRKLPAYEKKITLSTFLTILRIILVPVIVLAMIQHYWGISFFLFVVAAITDCLDGTLARLLNQKTFLGAFLDPLADKFLILSCFFTLAFVQSPLFIIPKWFVACVLCKELLQLGGALFVYMQKGHIEIRPTWLGKITATAQMGFIVWLFACYFFQWVPIKTYYTMLGLLLLLITVSLIQYALIGIRFLRA
jgi:cardiolipin synthase